MSHNTNRVSQPQQMMQQQQPQQAQQPQNANSSPLISTPIMNLMRMTGQDFVQAPQHPSAYTFAEDLEKSVLQTTAPHLQRHVPQHLNMNQGPQMSALSPQNLSTLQALLNQQSMQQQQQQQHQALHSAFQQLGGNSVGLGVSNSLPGMGPNVYGNSVNNIQQLLNNASRSPQHAALQNAAASAAASCDSPKAANTSKAQQSKQEAKPPQGNLQMLFGQQQNKQVHQVPSYHPQNPIPTFSHLLPQQSTHAAAPMQTPLPTGNQPAKASQNLENMFHQSNQQQYGGAQQNLPAAPHKLPPQGHDNILEKLRAQINPQALEEYMKPSIPPSSQYSMNPTVQFSPNTSTPQPGYQSQQATFQHQKVPSPEHQPAAPLRDQTTSEPLLQQQLQREVERQGPASQPAPTQKPPTPREETSPVTLTPTQPPQQSPQTQSQQQNTSQQDDNRFNQQSQPQLEKNILQIKNVGGNPEEEIKKYIQDCHAVAAESAHAYGKHENVWYVAFNNEANTKLVWNGSRMQRMGESVPAVKMITQQQLPKNLSRIMTAKAAPAENCGIWNRSGGSDTGFVRKGGNATSDAPKFRPRAAGDETQPEFKWNAMEKGKYKKAMEHSQLMPVIQIPGPDGTTKGFSAGRGRPTQKRDPAP